MFPTCLNSSNINVRSVFRFKTRFTNRTHCNLMTDISAKCDNVFDALKKHNVKQFLSDCINVDHGVNECHDLY